MPAFGELLGWWAPSMPALGELLGMDGGLGLIGGIDVWSDGGMDGRAVSRQPSTLTPSVTQSALKLAISAEVFTF